MQSERRIASPETLARWRHDVRNRLNAISGYSSLLQMEELTSEQQEYLREISEASREIEALLDVLRDHLEGDDANPSGEPKEGATGED